MNARVDVLAVMDEAALSQPIRGDRQDMREARDAVAELIEAVPRAIQMLHVASARAISFSPDRITNYDDADCDGYCVHGDCIAAITDLQRALSRIGAD